MTRLSTGGVVGLLAALGLVASADARPADVRIVSPLSLQTTVTNTVKVSTTPAAPSRIDLGIISFFSGQSTAEGFDTRYPVPAGKDLIITGASGYLARGFGDNTALRPRFHLIIADGYESLYAPLTSPSQSFFSWTAPQTMVATDYVYHRAGREDTTGTGYAQAVLWGYLVSEGSTPAAAGSGPARTAPESPALTPP